MSYRDQQIFKKVKEVVARRLGFESGETRFLIGILLEAIKKKDIHYLNSRPAVAVFKVLGFDSVEFMDMANNLVCNTHKYKDPKNYVNIEKSHLDPQEYAELRERTEEIYKEYLSTESYRATARKYNVSSFWIRQLLKDKPKAKNTRYTGTFTMSEQFYSRKGDI
jgi:hypothetical protein